MIFVVVSIAIPGLYKVRKYNSLDFVFISVQQQHQQTGQSARNSWLIDSYEILLRILYHDILIRFNLFQVTKRVIWNHFQKLGPVSEYLIQSLNKLMSEILFHEILFLCVNSLLISIQFLCFKYEHNNARSSRKKPESSLLSHWDFSNIPLGK